MAHQGFFEDGLTDLHDPTNMNRMVLQYGNIAQIAALSADFEGISAWIYEGAGYPGLLRTDGSSWVVMFKTDQAAGTPSLRTLGTNATQAAAGDHTH